MEAGTTNGSESRSVDFSHMTAEQIAEEIDNNGFRICDAGVICEALERDQVRREAEDWEKAKDDWMKFKCHPVDIEFSIPISHTDNFDGSFYRKARCKIESKNMLRRLYNEATELLNIDRLYNSAMNEIIYFADGRFNVCRIKTHREYSTEIAKELDAYLDMESLKKEMEQRLKSIDPVKLRPFEYYYNMTEYRNIDEYNGDVIGEFIWDAIGLVKRSWNYSGYDAYFKLGDDARDVAWRFADDATKAARAALEKRIEWKDALLKSA